MAYLGIPAGNRGAESTFLLCLMANMVLKKPASSRTDIHLRKKTCTKDSKLQG